MINHGVFFGSTVVFLKNLYGMLFCLHVLSSVCFVDMV